MVKKRGSGYGVVLPHLAQMLQVDQFSETRKALASSEAQGRHWWRRRELNPGPKIVNAPHLHV